MSMMTLEVVMVLVWDLVAEGDEVSRQWCCALSVIIKQWSSDLTVMSWFNRVIIKQWCYYLTVLSLHSDAGLYNATKTLAFASYFCKMWVQILYWSPDGKLIFSEHFHSITDRIFHFKIWLWFSSPLNHTIDSDINVLNHVLLTLASDHDKRKSKTFIQNFLLKINWLN
jgi:hypothetical protein